MHALKQDALKELISDDRNQARGLDFVFVSACRSEDAGQAFADAGVPHVVRALCHTLVEQVKIRLQLDPIFAYFPARNLVPVGNIHFW